MRLSRALLAIVLAASAGGGGARATESSTTGVVPGTREFQRYCSACHMTGGRAGPELTKDFLSGREIEVRKKIVEGGGQMPAFKYLLSSQQTDVILSYLKGLDKPPSLISTPRVAP